MKFELSETVKITRDVVMPFYFLNEHKNLACIYSDGSYIAFTWLEGIFFDKKDTTEILQRFYTTYINNQYNLKAEFDKKLKEVKEKINYFLEEGKP